MNRYFNEKSTQMTTKQRKGIHSTAQPLGKTTRTYDYKLMRMAKIKSS